MRKLLFIFSCLLVLAGCRKLNPTQPEPPGHGYFPLDEFGNCGANTKVHGIWYNGLPTNTDSNYVDVAVYVTSPGSYKITSDTLDGVYFTGAGEFPDSGATTVRLKGSGKFSNPGELYFHIRFDSSACQFYMPVNDSLGLSIGGNVWRFTAEGRTYSGPFSAQSFSIPQSSATDFELGGSIAGTDTAFAIDLASAEGYGSLEVGAYPTSGSDLDFVGLYTTNPNGGVVQYIYKNSTAAGAVVTVNIVSIVNMLDPFYHVTVMATFSGTVLNSEGKLVPLTNGRFKWGTP
ncbi:MAG TPA: hypothetical protein VHD83_10380 [Puia sp.]|nr:hypothetical protein [Puia sp.]